MNLYHTVRARWRPVVAAFLAVVGLVVVSEALPKQYSSQLRFLVPPDHFVCWVGAEEADRERQAFYLAQFAKVQSPGVLTNVIQNLGLDLVYAQREGLPGISTLAAVEE